MPLRLSCYPNTSKQSGPLAGAGLGGGARLPGPCAAAGRPPEGGAGLLLKPGTPGREQPGEGRGRGQSSERAPLEGDGPARLQAPTLPGVRGYRLAEARGSARALSARFASPGLYKLHVHSLRRRRGSALVFAARRPPDHVRGSRDSARKKKFARRGPNDFSEPRASLPGPGLSRGAQADLSERGECPLWEGAAAAQSKEGRMGVGGVGDTQILGPACPKFIRNDFKRNHMDAVLGHCVSHFIGFRARHSQLTSSDTHLAALFLVLFCDI